MIQMPPSTTSSPLAVETSQQSMASQCRTSNLDLLPPQVKLIHKSFTSMLKSLPFSTEVQNVSKLRINFFFPF
jgi:Tfp pilus assembly protein PilO